MTTALKPGWSSWYVEGDEPDREIPGLLEADAGSFIRSVLATLQHFHYRGVFRWDGRSRIELTSPGGKDVEGITVALYLRAFHREIDQPGLATEPVCAVILEVGARRFCFHKEAVPQPGTRQAPFISAEMIAAVALHVVSQLTADPHAVIGEALEPALV